jgi:hypothetical protein
MGFRLLIEFSLAGETADERKKPMSAPTGSQYYIAPSEPIGGRVLKKTVALAGVFASG